MQNKHISTTIYSICNLIILLSLLFDSIHIIIVDLDAVDEGLEPGAAAVVGLLAADPGLLAPSPFFIPPPSSEILQCKTNPDTSVEVNLPSSFRKI